MIDLEKFKKLFSTYPHLEKKILFTWGTPEGRTLLTSLLSDSRDGARAGFAPEDASAIFQLLLLHDKEFPQFDLDHSLPFVHYNKPLPVTNYETNGFTQILKWFAYFIIGILAVGFLREFL